MIQEEVKASQKKIHPTLSKWIQKHIYNCYNNTSKDCQFINRIVKSLLNFQQRHLQKYSSQYTESDKLLLQQKHLKIVQKRHNPHYKKKIQFLQQYQKDPKKYLAETFSKFCKNPKMISNTSKGLCQLALLVFMFSFKITLTQFNGQTSSSDLLQDARLKSQQQIKNWIKFRSSYKEEDKCQIQKKRKQFVYTFFQLTYCQKLQIKQAIQGQDKINCVVRSFLSYFLSINFFEQLSSKIQKVDFQQKQIKKQRDYKTQLCSLCNMFWKQVKDPQQTYQVKAFTIQDFKNIQWVHDLQILKKNQRQYVKVPNLLQVKKKLLNYLQNKIEMINSNKQDDRLQIDKKKLYQKQLFQIALEKTMEINQQSTDNFYSLDRIYNYIKKEICEDQMTIKMFSKLQDKNNQNQLKDQSEINEEDSKNMNPIIFDLLVDKDQNEIIKPKNFSSNMEIQQNSSEIQNHSRELSSQFSLGNHQLVQSSMEQNGICENRRDANPQQLNFIEISRSQTDWKMEEQSKQEINQSSQRNLQMIEIQDFHISNKSQDIFTTLLSQFDSKQSSFLQFIYSFVWKTQIN